MAIQRIVVQAPAKINLYLGVSLQRMLVGYHRLSTLMGTVGLYDQVTLEPSDRLSLICRPSVRTSMENNTASMAALFFAEALDRPADVAITLDKTIPAQAGLGGGSADAAAVLLGLCAAWGIDPFDPLVHGVAASVGADVPFFLTGGLALMGGAGDQLEETFSAVPFHAVLVRPGGAGVSTPRAYEAFDAHPEPAAPLEPLVDAVAAANVDAMAAACANNLEPAAFELLPATRQVAQFLSAQPGVLNALVTGSGSCVFGLCRDAGAADVAATEAARLGWWSRAVSSTPYGCRIVEDGWRALP